MNQHKIKIEFIEYIRENRKFPDLKSLKNQILLDINRAKKIFKDLR
jgi:FAD synthase